MVELSKLKGIFGAVGHSKVNASNVDDVLAAVDENLPLTEDNVKEAKYLAWQLNNIVADTALDTNAKTRRRVKRIMQRLGEAHAGVNFEEEYVEEPEPVFVAEKIDVTAAAQRLKEAKSISDVESILNSLTGPGPDAKLEESWATMKSVLYKVLDNRNLTNKNIRRRITRLIFVLADEQDLEKLNLLKQSVVPPPVKKVYPVSAPVVVRKVAESVAAPVLKAEEPVEPTKPMVVLKSFHQCLDELEAAASTAEVDAAISAVSANSSGDGIVKRLVRERLQSLAADETLVSNTKIKRKVLRLISTLESAPADGAVPVAAASASSELKKRSLADATTTDVGEAPGASDIQSIIKRLKAVRSAEELDAVLVKVDMRTIVPAAPQDGGAEAEAQPITSVTCEPAQRRQLKAVIEQVLAQEDVSSSMNAKVRRRATRITGILAEADGEAVENSTTPVAAALDSDAERTPAISSVNKPPLGEQKKVPYVLFVGNLSYDVTAVEIEEHLRAAAALEGPVKVRLRTDPHTKRGLGVAFVEVEGTKELHQCISLGHHSNLRGRVINVEKSCGGRNKEQRGEKIASKRTEQQRRTQEAINTVLVQFEQKGVLQNTHKWGETLKEMVYAHSPASVTEVTPWMMSFVNSAELSD